MTLFNQYRRPAEREQGIPIVGGDDLGSSTDIGASLGYGQDSDDSDEDYSSGGLYGPPAAQKPPSVPSPNAPMSNPGGGQPPPGPQGAPPPPQAPPQSPYAVKVQQAINDRADMKRPALPQPGIWRQLAGTLAGTAIGAIGGQRKEALQQGADLSNAIKYGPTAIRAQGQYDQKVADADAELKAIEAGENILTKGDERLTNADTRKTNAATRQAQLAGLQTSRAAAEVDSRLKMQEAVTKSGGKQVAFDAPPTPGTIRVPDPMDLDTATGQFKGKTVLEVPEHKGEVQVTAATQDLMQVPAGTWLPADKYLERLSKHEEFALKPPREGQMPVPNVSQLNQALEARYQVLNKGAKLPPYLTVPPNAVKDDYDRVNVLMENIEKASGVKANQDANRANQEANRIAANGHRDDTADHVVKTAALKAFTPALDSAERLNVMVQNESDGVQHHDQQAMLSLLANHLGMTMGLQKGARLTKDIIHEAEASRPWLQGLAAKFDKDGYLAGVNLTPSQMRQMVNLGRMRLAEDVVKARNESQYQGSTDDGPKRTPSVGTMRLYGQLAQGDVAKAKKLAADDGWSVDAR